MFNESQMKAISHGKGPAMVLAGPGTGKTTVITHRVKRLVEKEYAKPEEILVVTFTKAAATEMQERYEKLMEGKCYGSKVTFGTFHSVFYQMLRKSDESVVGSKVLGDRDKHRILREIVMRLKVDNIDLQDFIEKASDEISRLKGSYEDVYENQVITDICDGKTFVKIYKEYQGALLAEKKIDFDDMIWKCNHMLISDEQALKHWQSIYKFILVDEFQDINRCQYENVKLLAGDGKNVFIVGDDDQSIYGFRGAGPELMFAFQREFAGTEIINLNVNYRCTAQIMRVADNLIRHNENRYEKRIVSDKGDGAKIDIREFDSNVQQYKVMSNKIKEYLDLGVKPEEMVILVRNNESIPLIRNFLSDRKINVETKKKENLYSHSVARDVISYIRAAESYKTKPIIQNIPLMDIINKPERYISRQVITDEDVNWSALKNIYIECGEIQKNINELEMHLNMINQLTPYAALNYIRYGANYDGYMRVYANRNGVRYEELLKVFNLLQQDASRYKNKLEWLEQMEENALSANENSQVRGIPIMTMHASKGLEFPVVFIPDVNQGVIPGMRAIRECDVEEERRVFYVALTRASKYLHVYSPKQIMGRKLQSSQFLNEMSICLHF